MKRPRVFYAVLNMGLGHAARSLPIIRELTERGCEVLVGSNGRSLAFLQNELPELSFIETPAYDIEYARGALMIPKLMVQIPGFLKQIKKETRFCADVVARYSPDIIFSDHCYGMYHPGVPSYMLSHQIYFAMPPGLNGLSGLISQFNFGYHRHYRKIVIPDFPGEDGGLLSGGLSRIPHHPEKYEFSGILSSLEEFKGEKSLNILVSVSGPEPQRTIFEEIVLKQIREVPGNKIVVLGKSESEDLLIDEPELKVYSHLPRSQMAKVINEARLIVSRPGYTTLMELVETGRKALFVPTAGQTEQQYLGKRMMQKKWFYSVHQNRLNLKRDIELAGDFSGLHRPGATANAVKFIVEKVLGIE